ncbi:MAG: alpha/beta fold hydrolase [Jatrophihabitans sp.]|uniref:alpha/beta fold hydrolase n=1 Tax=Jatrophihabitans sp. TaxID=1932789 RepID=UPI003F7F1493
MLVHGVTHRRQVWYPVVEQLAEHREVVLVDLPGHGQSDPFVLDGLSVKDALRRDFETFLAEQGLERPHVAGNSLGGLVALHAGANGHARSVTCLSPAGFWRDEKDFAHTRRFFTSLLQLTERLGHRTEDLVRFAPVRQTVFGVLMAHPSRVPTDHVIGDVRGFLKARPALSTLLQAAEPFTDPIPGSVPVTVAWAARDLVLPVTQARTAQARLPFAEHLIMRGVGHVPMFDNPTLVADILLRGTMPSATVAPIASAHRRPARRRVAAVAGA